MSANIILDAAKFAIEWTESQSRHRRMEEIATRLTTISSKLDDVQDRLRAIQAQAEQLILREVRAAFDALDDARRSKNPATVEARLRFAEDSFLKNTRLDPSSTLGGLTTTEIMLLAHQGLATICALRQDHEMAERHLLQLFVLDPHSARTAINPLLYERLFAPRCQDIIERYDQQEADRRTRRELRDQRTSSDPSITVRATAELLHERQVNPTVAGVVLSTVLVGSLLRTGVQIASIVSGGFIDAVASRSNAIRRDAELDKRCREVAIELLRTGLND